jgi:hypothetical protein
MVAMPFELSRGWPDAGYMLRPDPAWLVLLLDDRPQPGPEALKT